MYVRNYSNICMSDIGSGLAETCSLFIDLSQKNTAESEGPKIIQIPSSAPSSSDYSIVDNKAFLSLERQWKHWIFSSKVARKAMRMAEAITVIEIGVAIDQYLMSLVVMPEVVLVRTKDHSEVNHLVLAAAVQTYRNTM